MKNHRNEGGWTIVAVLMVLSILTIMGTYSIMRSNTEVKCATNELIYNMNFYAAESGEPIAIVEHLEGDENLQKIFDNFDPDWSETSTMALNNGTEFTYVLSHRKDEDGNVLRWGDPDGDHIWEVNTAEGYPFELVVTDGTHKGRGGLAKVEVGLGYHNAFEFPGAPLWVDDPYMVNFQGNASVIGDSLDEDVCADVPDVLHHITPIDPMDEPKHYGDEFIHKSSGGMYPFSEVKESLMGNANYIGNVFPKEIGEGSTIDDPVIIIIEGDLHLNDDDLSIPGTGILFVDGDLKLNGNLEWNGLIVTTGSASVGNGTANINGSLVTGESADVEISGTIVLQYRCDILKKLHDNFSGYKRQWWRRI